MERKEALKHLLTFSNLINEDEKIYMIEHIEELTDEQIEAIGSHLALEAKYRIEAIEKMGITLTSDLNRLVDFINNQYDR